MIFTFSTLQLIYTFSETIIKIHKYDTTEIMSKNILKILILVNKRDFQI